MRKVWIIGMALMVLGMLQSGAWAKDAVTMDKVVVTASRDEEKTTKVPANITVITAEEIEKSTAQNVADVLSTLAGAHVIDPGGNQRNYFVGLRGYGESGAQNALMLVDGRRVNLPDLSGPDWNLIALDRIERIEVIRGSRGAVLYGDNATQGVINIITKEGDKLEGSVTAQFGSYGTAKSSTAVSGASGMVSYDVSASIMDTDGYRDNSESSSQDLGANVRIDPSDTVRLQISAGYHHDDTRNPGAILDSQFEAGAERTDTFQPDNFSEVDDVYLKTSLEIDMLTNDTFKVEASVRERDTSFYGSSDAYWFEADTQSGILTLSPQLIFRGDFDGIANRITIGGDYTNAKQDFDNVSEYFGSPSQIVATLKKENRAWYFHDDLSVGERLSISGGYRADFVTFKYDPVSGTDQRDIDEEAYNAGVNYAFGPKSHVYVTYTHSFRYPVLDEQFSYFTSSVDTTMQPQTADEYEVGASVEVASDLVLSLSLFRSDTEDEIFFNFSNSDNENLDGTTIRQGAELGVAWQYKSFSVSGIYTRTFVEIDGGQFDGKEYPFVPENKVAAVARYELGAGVAIGLEATYTGERVLVGDWENGYDKVDAYTVVNANVEYDWRWFTFFVDLNNIFNEEYATFSGLGYNASYAVEPGEFPAPEFNFLMGVRARFGSNQ